MMDELQCEGFFKYYPSLLQLKELRLTFIANCSINNFLTYTAVMLNITTIYAIQKTTLLPDFKNIAAESRCFWYWRWFICSTISLIFFGHLDATPKSQLYNLPNKQCCCHAICGCFFPWCCGSKCRQVLCHPFSSQIQWDCDSQARCCGSELSLDLQCFRFFNESVVSCWYWEDCSFGYCSYRSRCYRCCVYQGKGNCSTAQESDSVLASTGSSSSQWY